MEKPALFIPALLSMLLACAPLQAQQAAQQQTLKLPSFLSDHMVLQRDAPIHLWGQAAPSDPVQVTLNTPHPTTAQSITDDLGNWSVYLPPQPAGGPYTLQITGPHSSQTRTDIMLGDVWLASGQSNMEMPLNGFVPTTPVKDGPAEIAAADHPELRLLLIPHTGAETPQANVAATWQRCTPQTAATFSAVAYFFGRELQQNQHVAIGLIDSTWGGTPAESWVSMQTFGADPALAPVWAAYADFIQANSMLPQLLEREAREDAAAKAAGKPAPAHPWHPPIDAYRPATLYNGMIAPLTPMSIRGVLWYQGETNSGAARVALYHRLLSGLVADWRMHFQQGSFPFLIAQISNFNSPGEFWGALRDAQRQTLSVANTSLAVTLDIGERNNVHPPDKATVGHRLALGARALSYGEHVHDQGPLFARADPEGAAMRVWFIDTHTALACTGGPCHAFEVAGEDHHFAPADATIAGTSIIVSSAAVPQPRFVRYAWPSWTDANLHDAEGLPASTFTSEPDYVLTARHP